jgi:hypothetical protein
MEVVVSYRVVIRCPTTGEELCSIEGFSKERSLIERPVSSLADCPHCGQRHEWHIDEARCKIDDHH